VRGDCFKWDTGECEVAAPEGAEMIVMLKRKANRLPNSFDELKAASVAAFSGSAAGARQGSQLLKYQRSC
jgi:hypothetical protein